MGIIDRLKKEKKRESVLDSLIKKKEAKPDETEQKKKQSDLDVEVRELNPSSAGKTAEPEDLGMEVVQTKSIQEFRTEGMHEFELDSLGASSDANVKAEYKSRVTDLIDKNKLDEAISLLQELKQRFANKK